MDVLILYHSRTGKTRKLAEYVAEGVAETGLTYKLCSVEQVEIADFENAKAVIAGSPTYFGMLSAELKKVFDDFIPVRKKMLNKIGAAFSTSNHPHGGNETTLISILQCFLIYGMIVAGDPFETGGHFGVAAYGQITGEYCNDAKLLGVRIAGIVKKMYFNAG